MTKAVPENIAHTLERMKGVRVVVVGDVMLDEYIYGITERISPEAPEPIVLEQSREYIPGGAANVASNIHALGGTVFLFGVTGEDEEGIILRKKLHNQGIDAGWLLVSENRPTTRKTRVISRYQQALRLDREIQEPITEVETDKMIAEIRETEAEGIVVSDYGKGVVTTRLMKGLKKQGRPVFVDPKGKIYEKYRGCTLLTPNKRELLEVLESRNVSSDALDEGALKMLHDLDLKALLVTRGSEGMTLYTPDSPPFQAPTQARNVFDVTGAGDTVIAALAAAAFSGADLKTACVIANTAAGLVVGKRNTAVVTISEIAEYLYSTIYTEKVKALPELSEIVTALKKTGKRVVFTNGCFDLLHVGHIKYLHEASLLGDVLVVGVNTDSSVRRIKGPSRPIVGEMERSHIIAALESVDYIILFEEDTPLNLIKTLKPDVLVKGADYTLDEVVGRREVESYGGSVRIVPITHDASTSKIIQNIITRSHES